MDSTDEAVKRTERPPTPYHPESLCPCTSCRKAYQRGFEDGRAK